MTKEYDLVVIGTGSAGSTVAHTCRAAGWKVAIIDSKPFGGTCALRGCDPKKIMVGAAEIIDRSTDMKGKGISKDIEINWKELMSYKKTFTDPVPESRENGFLKAGIDAFHGHASFTGKNTIKIGSDVLTAKHTVIATGAIPMKLNIPGEEHITTSDQFLEMEAMPKSITFIGGGFISFELAHIAARAGSKVRIIHRSGAPLKIFDPDLVSILVKAFQDLGIEIHLNAPVDSIEKKSEKLIVHSGDEEFESDMVVHGAGRVPDIEELQLEKAGVKVDKGIVINDYLQSVSNTSVYVAGDTIAGVPALTPVSSMEGLVVAKNLLEGNKAKPDYSIIPSVVFSVPPLASVGLSEEEAKKRGLNYTVNHQDTSSWYSSRRIGLKYSGFKTIVDKDTDKIFGAHLLGHNSDELINVFAVAMKANFTVEDLKKMLFAYPTHASDIGYMLG